MSASSPAGSVLLVLAGAAVLGLAVLVAFPGLVPRAGGSGSVLETAAGGGVAAGRPAGERPAADLSAASPAVRTTLAERPYTVVGGNAQELLASMAGEAPRTGGEAFFGLTVTELSFRYVHAMSRSACRLYDVQVDLAVSVALPAWEPPPSASYELRRDWTRFAQSLRRHEDRHRVLAEAGAETIRTRLHGLTAPTCAAVDAEARRVADGVRIETDAAHRRYDSETGHGRTQGAVWPLP